MTDHIRLVRLRNLHDSSLQPRSDYPAAELQELAASIRAHGILQPLVARPINAAAPSELVQSEPEAGDLEMAEAEGEPFHASR